MEDKCVACGHSVVTGCISDVKASVSHYDAWEPNSHTDGLFPLSAAGGSIKGQLTGSEKCPFL